MLGDEPDAIGILLEPLAQTLIGQINERHHLFAQTQLRNHMPLLARQIRAAWVVAATVQKQDIALPHSLDRRDHRLEVDSMRIEVVVGVLREVQTGELEQREMVGPRRITEINLSVGPRAMQQVTGNAERPATARRLNRRDAAGGDDGMTLAEYQALHAGIEAGVTGNGDIGLGGLCSEELLLAATNRFENRRVAVVVLIDANAEINLVRAFVGAKQSHDADDRIGRESFQSFEHSLDSSLLNGVAESVRYSKEMLAAQQYRRISPPGGR